MSKPSEYFLLFSPSLSLPLCFRFCLNCPDFDIIPLLLDLIVNQFTFCGASSALKANTANLSAHARAQAALEQQQFQQFQQFPLPLGIQINLCVYLGLQCTFRLKISCRRLADCLCGTLLLLIAWHNCSDSIEIYGRAEHRQMESRDVSQRAQLKAHYDNITPTYVHA